MENSGGERGRDVATGDPSDRTSDRPIDVTTFFAGSRTFRADRRAGDTALPFLLAVPDPARAQGAAPWCFTGIHPGEVEGTVYLPEGDLFCTLLADPTAERSFMSFLRGSFPSFDEGVDVDGDLSIASVGLGDAFPFVRLGIAGAGNGLQVGLVGSIFAQSSSTPSRTTSSTRTTWSGSP